jgi:hypothetical protein
MPIQRIEIGGYANDGTGDDLRTAFNKVNANFTLLDSDAQINDGATVGTGTAVLKGKTSTILQFKSLTSTDNSVTLTSTDNTVNLKANTILSTDIAPTLGGNLNLNGNSIFGAGYTNLAGTSFTGDVKSSVWGVDIVALNALVSLLIESNKNLAIDLGSFNNPTGYETNANGYAFDMGTFVGYNPTNRFNFGTFV